MREGRDGSSKFIFDLMEPERPKVDRAMLDFVKATVFDPADFIIRSDGVVRLNSQLARCRDADLGVAHSPNKTGAPPLL
jgi:CRISP-associated protein Cas1